MQLTLDKFGRVVIPKAIRDELGLHPGDVLDVEEDARRIVLRPAGEHSPVTAKDGLLVFSGAAVGDLEKAVPQHRRGHLARASGAGKSHESAR